jgi:hypothetical protein
VQQIERLFLPVFWEYNQKESGKKKKNAVASCFLFDEFSHSSQNKIKK